MEDRKLKPKMATAKIEFYKKSLSGRLSGMFSDNRNLGSNSSSQPNNLYGDIEQWVNKHSINEYAYNDLVSILNNYISQ